MDLKTSTRFSHPSLQRKNWGQYFTVPFPDLVYQLENMLWILQINLEIILNKFWHYRVVISVSFVPLPLFVCTHACIDSSQGSSGQSLHYCLIWMLYRKKQIESRDNCWNLELISTSCVQMHKWPEGQGKNCEIGISGFWSVVS